MSVQVSTVTLSTNGIAKVACKLMPRITYTVYIERQDSDELVSAIFHVSVDDHQLMICKKLFLHTEDTIFPRLYLNGMQDLILLNPILPGATFSMTFIPSDAMYTLQNKIESLEYKIEKQQICIDTLKSKLEEMYWAPGMPGYERANISFEKHASIE